MENNNTVYRRKGKYDPDKALRKLYSTYKSKCAKSRGFEFDLTLEEFKELTSDDCFYCGRQPSTVHYYSSEDQQYIYNGIDRLDTKRGYTLHNCVPCCTQCNTGKWDYTYQEFIEMCYLVSKKHAQFLEPKDKLVM
jgi:hypothetical protein